jgi:hypothetical protein
MARDAREGQLPTRPDAETFRKSVGSGGSFAQKEIAAAGISNEDRLDIAQYLAQLAGEA